MGTFTKTIVIDAPPAAVWAALADIGSIHVWNPGVVASRTTTPAADGLGASRRCELGGRNYLDEQVVEWIPERIITMRITATNLPFKSADVRFTLERQGQKTSVDVSPIYALKFGALGKILDAVAVRSRYQQGMARLLHGLKTHVEESSRTQRTSETRTGATGAGQQATGACGRSECLPS
jgi:uncharacterized protein YndB with AHSA1/START domain